MTLPPAAEALYDALERRASGSLELVANGQRSTVSVFEGDVVAAQVGFGFQSQVQALWREGQLSAQQLDALWSSGEGGEPDPDSLHRLGLDPHLADGLRWRVQLKELVERAQEIRFDASTVAAGPVRLRGVHAVRAACEATPVVLEGRRFHVRDLAACVPWLATQEEARWLEGLQGYVAGDDVPPMYGALLAVLERAGLAESLSEQEYRARQSVGQRAGVHVTEETTEREYPAGWEGALQLDLPPDMTMVSVGGPAPERAEDPARSLTPTTLPAVELAEASWGELVEPPPRVVARPTSPSVPAPLEAVAAELAQPEPIAASVATPVAVETLEIELEAEPEPVAAAPVESIEIELQPEPEPIAEPVPERIQEEQAASQARNRAQADLIREMNEALRRAGAAPAEDWLSEGEAPPPSDAATPAVSEPLMASEPMPVSETVDLPELLLGDADADLPPLEARPSPPVPAGDVEPSPIDADLWRILEFDPPQSGTSFEQALSSVDAQLEALVGSLPIEPDLPEVLFEATFEPTGDNLRGSDQTFEADTGEEEDELAGDPSDPGEAARQRRHRLLRRAMENLGAFAPRTTPPSGAVEVTPEAPAPVAAAAPEAKAAPAGTPDEHQLATLIEKRYADVKGGVDRFALMGIDRNASKDAVKAAFLNLAKVFHPDRLPPSLASLAPKMTAVFEAIRESYELLYDDTKRKGYIQSLELKELTQANAPTDPAEQAEEAFKKAETLFKKRDYVAAEELYTKAHELKASASYLAGRAWAIYMDPARKSEVTRAKQLMNDALKMDARNDRVHYQLGVVARVEGEHDRAERHFRDAVNANPKHLEAAQELRLIEMRKKKKR